MNASRLNLVQRDTWPFCNINGLTKLSKKIKELVRSGNYPLNSCVSRLVDIKKPSYFLLHYISNCFHSTNVLIYICVNQSIQTGMMLECIVVSSYCLTRAMYKFWNLVDLQIYFLVRQSFQVQGHYCTYEKELESPTSKQLPFSWRLCDRQVALCSG